MQNIFKVNNRSTRCGSGVFIINFEYIQHVILVFFFADFEHVNGRCNVLLSLSKFTECNLGKVWKTHPS